MAQQELARDQRREMPRPAGDELVGIALMAGQGMFPTGSSSLMLGESFHMLDVSGIVYAVILTADGNVRIGVGPHDKKGQCDHWFVYKGPFCSRLKETKEASNAAVRR